MSCFRRVLAHFVVATSAIDYETDNIIQTSLRSKLDKDVTLLTVAHRLQTIMDSDRIVSAGDLSHCVPH